MRKGGGNWVDGENFFNSKLELEALEERVVDHVLHVLQHDGYLYPRGGGYRFDSGLPEDWWCSRYGQSFFPVFNRQHYLADLPRNRGRRDLRRASKLIYGFHCSTDRLTLPFAAGQLCPSLLRPASRQSNRPDHQCQLPDRFPQNLQRQFSPCQPPPESDRAHADN